MSTKKRTPFSRIVSQDPRVLATLTPEETATLRAATQSLADANRRAELAAAKARVEVGEALEAQISACRALAAIYGFDPNMPLLLTPDGTLTLPPSQEPTK